MRRGQRWIRESRKINLFPGSFEKLSKPTCYHSATRKRPPSTHLHSLHAHAQPWEKTQAPLAPTPEKPPFPRPLGQHPFGSLTAGKRAARLCH